jgi:uncharacterized protein YjbI with pentapeptide repeats
MARGLFQEAEERQRIRSRFGVSASAFYIRGVPAPIILLALSLLWPGEALAACTAPAGPGVDWRRCMLDRMDAPGADLTGAVLRDASLSRANLAGARLVDVEGFTARFVSADLTGADLTGAVLRSADLTRATLARAVFVRADLRRARLFQADLTGADLTGAQLDGADFTGARLEGARWTDGQRVCAAGSVGSCR